jgi:hypothetical protein
MHTAAPGVGVVTHVNYRGQTSERGGTPVALLPALRSKRRVASYRESSRSLNRKEVRAAEGVLLSAGAVAVLVGLRALVQPLTRV